MKILVNDYGGMPFPLDLSYELARRGHEVSHLFFANNTSTPKGDTDRTNYEVPLSVEGIHIDRIFRKHSLFARRQADIDYGRAVAAKVNEIRPDIVLSANMPLDSQRLLMEAAHEQGARFIFWLQDVYSEAIRYVANRRVPLLGDLLAVYYRVLERRLLQKSESVVCIAPSFAALLKKWNIDSSRINMRENWSSLERVFPTPKVNAWSIGVGLREKFTFMYCGTLGVKHRPEVLLALGGYLERRGDAQLVVVGGGVGVDWLKERVKGAQDSAIRFLPFQPYSRLAEVLGSADVLVALLDHEANSFAVPSKILSYLCSGRPILIASPFDNEAAKTVVRAKAGLVASPKPQDVIYAARLFIDHESMRLECARNARLYAEKHFVMDEICSTFLRIFGAAHPTVQEVNGLQKATKLTV